MTLRVLVADDQSAVRGAVRRILEAEAATTVVGEAADGCEALDLLARVPADVAVLDLQMPRLGGVEATLRIGREHPGVAVVVHSMHAAAEGVLRALCAGAGAYVLKEASGSDLVPAILAVASGERFVSERIFLEHARSWRDGFEPPITRDEQELLARLFAAGGVGDGIGPARPDPRRVPRPRRSVDPVRLLWIARQRGWLRAGTSAAAGRRADGGRPADGGDRSG